MRLRYMVEGKWRDKESFVYDLIGVQPTREQFRWLVDADAAQCIRS